MPRKYSRNIEMLGIVAEGLKGLKEEIVFVGGATVDLFITDPAATGTRETDDVDCVIHPMDEEKPVLCRWKFRGIKVDVMPTDASVLGFGNRWYRDGMAHAEEFGLPNGERVCVFSVPYLLASKLEAFSGRGQGDFMASKDIEDIVALLDGCPDAEEKIVAAPAKVRGWLRQEFARLLVDKTFLLSLEGHLGSSPGVRERLDRCLKILARSSS